MGVTLLFLQIKNLISHVDLSAYMYVGLLTDIRKVGIFFQKYCEPTDELFYPGLTYQGNKVHDIRWNFEKILVDKTGKAVKRYNVYVLPANLRDDIRTEIQKSDVKQGFPVLGSFLG